MSRSSLHSFLQFCLLRAFNGQKDYQGGSSQGQTSENCAKEEEGAAASAAGRKTDYFHGTGASSHTCVHILHAE